MRGISLIFFLSGATGLVYEVVWAKALATVLGSSGLAQVVTLATFLGGLAVGYAWLGARADREPDPLAWYGRLELWIGVAGLGSLVAIELFRLVAGELWRFGGLDPLSFGALRLVAAIATMAPGAILMGGTLPALGRHLTLGGAALRVAVARLYFLNSAGAAAGALAAAMVLLPHLGVPGAIAAAAALNFALAAAVRALGRKPGAVAASGDPAPAEPDADAEPTPLARRLAPWLAAASGFAALSLEVAWTRTLSLVLGPTAPGFAIMLAAAVAGIALGSWIVARRRLPLRDPLAGYAIAMIGAAFAVLASLPLADRLPAYLLGLAGLAFRAGGGPATHLAIATALCFLFVVPAAAFLGMGLPFAARLGARRADEVGARVGAIFAANTAATVLGACLAGTVLLPAWGLRGLLVGSAAMALAAGVVAAGAALAPPAGRAIAAVTAAVVGFGGMLAALPPWDLPVLYGGAYRSINVAVQPYEDFLRARREVTPRYLVDDPHASVTVEDWRGTRVLRVDGKIDASSGIDMPTQLLIGHLPLLRDPEARDVFLVGLGAGVTAGALLAHPIQRLDLAEISPGVQGALRLFDAHNRNVATDPRLSLRAEDGLGRLMRSATRYDVIVSEPSNPWMVGVADLFTREFYQACQARLKPGGQMVQWLQTYEIDDDAVRMCLRTFQGVFPQVEVWQGLANDLILIGSDRPMRPSLDGMARRLAVPAVRDDLARINMRRLPTILSCQVLAPFDVPRVAGEGPQHTARRPRLEYIAATQLFQGKQSRAIYDVDRRIRANKTGAEPLWLESYIDARRELLSEADYEEIVAYHGAVTKSVVVADAFADDWARRRPDDVGLRLLSMSRLRGVGRLHEALAIARDEIRARRGGEAFRWAAAELETDLLEAGGYPPADRPAAYMRAQAAYAGLLRDHPRAAPRIAAMRIRAAVAQARKADATKALADLAAAARTAPPESPTARAYTALEARVRLLDRLGR